MRKPLLFPEELDTTKQTFQLSEGVIFTLVFYTRKEKKISPGK